MLVRSGSKCCSVISVQKELKAAGINPGPVDGEFGAASAQQVANIIKAQGGWKGKHDPRPGDAVTFRWDGSGGWADHVGMVERVFMRGGKKYVQTIEGNSGDRGRRKTYLASSSVINGYGTMTSTTG